MVWVVEQCKLWGDYGDVLVSGYVERDERGRLLLHRAGPFLPPISFPSLTREFRRPAVVSEEFREKLAGQFPAIEFREVLKDRIVKLPWHIWPRDADDPAKYPENGEPENYIWDGKHDRKVASSMPNAWEIVGPVAPLHLSWMKDPKGGYLDRLHGRREQARYEGLFMANGKRLVADDSARDWLANHADERVRFCEVELTNNP